MFILRRQLHESQFFQNCGTFNKNQNKKYHNFERIEIRATVFLKWTYFRYSYNYSQGTQRDQFTESKILSKNALKPKSTFQVTNIDAMDFTDSQMLFGSKNTHFKHITNK